MIEMVNKNVVKKPAENIHHPITLAIMCIFPKKYIIPYPTIDTIKPVVIPIIIVSFSLLFIIIYL
jgi:hypothetical protein